MAEIQRLRKEVASLKARLDKLQSRIDSKAKPSQPPSGFKRLLAGPYAQAVYVVLALAVAFSGKFDTRGTEIAIVAAFAIGAYGIYNHCSGTARQKIIAGLLILLYGSLLWKFNNYLIVRSGPLTNQQKSDFTALLRTVSFAPSYVELACPADDELTCIYAAKFIPLFQRAGWKVDGPQVQRVKLATPTASVVIVAFGPAKTETQNPDVGVWTRVNPWGQTLTTAFTFVLRAHVEQWNDPNLEPDRIRVYFGSTPKN
jgi:hypothetical protein